MNPFRAGREVAETGDFRRIFQLPRRPVRTPAELDALVRDMTDALKNPGGTMKLRGVQALALFEAMAEKGLFGPMGVGTGKTLVTMLAAVVMNAERPLLLLPAALVQKTITERAELARHWRISTSTRIFSYQMLGREQAARQLDLYRPDLIIADEVHKLKNKRAAVTRRVARWMGEHPETAFVALSGTVLKNSVRDFAHILRWCLGGEHAPIPQKDGEAEEWADALDEKVQPLQRMRPGALVKLAKPEDISADELSTARKAFRRRLVETPGVVASLGVENVDCSLVIEGKTYDVNQPTRDNFHTLRTLWETPDGWTLSEAVEVWRHAKELALGFHYVRVDARKYKEWAATQRKNERKIGATGSATSTGFEPMTGRGVGVGIRRLASGTRSAADTESLSRNTARSSRSSMGVATSVGSRSEGYASTTITSPDASGAFYASPATEPSESLETMPEVLDEHLNTFLESNRPPDEWLARRKAWAKFVREELSGSRALDTEKQVRSAVERGELEDDGLLASWKEIEPTFQPLTIAVWHDDAALDICARWLERERGIVWCKHTFFARELSKRTGLPYFGQNGQDARGREIDKDPSVHGPVIASIDSCATGKNLQFKWHKNLITDCPSGGDLLEQLLGRTHRTGQPADEVEVEVLVGCAEHVSAWESARAESVMSTDMLGQPYKALFADVVFPTKADIAPLAHRESHGGTRATRWEKVKRKKGDD